MAKSVSATQQLTLCRADLSPTLFPLACSLVCFALAFALLLFLSSLRRPSLFTLLQLHTYSPSFLDSPPFRLLREEDWQSSLARSRLRAAIHTIISRLTNTLSLTHTLTALAMQHELQRRA